MPSLRGTAISALNLVVRCEASHNNERGLNKKADNFRNLRKALHLCVGAKAILTLNQIWSVNTTTTTTTAATTTTYY